MKFKSIITAGLLAAVVGSVPLLAGCGGSASASKGTDTTSKATKEELIEKLKEAGDAASWTIDYDTKLDVTVGDTKVTITTEGDVKAVGSTGAFSSDTKTTTKLGQDSQKSETTIYGTPYGAPYSSDSYNVYQGTPGENGNKTWTHETLDKTSYYDEYGNYCTNGIAEYTTTVKDLSLGSEEKLNSISCYTLTGNISVGDFKKIYNISQDETDVNENTRVAATLYFKADTKEFYGIKFDVKEMAEQVFAAQGETVTVNASDYIMIYSLNSVKDIEVPADVISSADAG